MALGTLLVMWQQEEDARRKRKQEITQGLRDLAVLHVNLAEVVKAYLDEMDNPAPDPTMRQILRGQLQAALTRIEEFTIVL